MPTIETPAERIARIRALKASAAGHFANADRHGANAERHGANADRHGEEAKELFDAAKVVRRQELARLKAQAEDSKAEFKKNAPGFAAKVGNGKSLTRGG